MNGRAQARWDDDGGAMRPSLAIEAAPAELDVQDRETLLDQLEAADRYFTESEHRITRQQNLISKLRAKHQATLLAVEFLRSLQASRVMHGASRSRLQRALAALEARLVKIQTG